MAFGSSSNIVEGRHIPLIPDIWVQINNYLTPLDIVILGSASRIFRLIAAFPKIWTAIGKNTFCFISENEDPRNVVYLTLKKAHRAGMSFFPFRHQEVHFFKRHSILIESIRDVAQHYFNQSQSTPDLLRLLLQAGARPSPDHYKGSCLLHLPFETSQLCLESGALPTRLLLYCHLNGTFDQVRYIVQKGVNPDYEIIKEALRLKVTPEILNYLLEHIGELHQYDIIVALEDHFPLDIIIRMVPKVKKFTDLVMCGALKKNAPPELVRLFVSKIEKPFTMTYLQIGDEKRSISLGFEGEIALPPPFGVFETLFPSGTIHIHKWEVFQVVDPVTF